MGSTSFLVSLVSVAAFRVILGSDVGLSYDSTALSTWRIDRYNEPLERTPWALEVRPDIMVALFNSRQFGYLMGDGSFAQPFALDPMEGDNPEGTGNLLLGARLRLGRRLIFHPGAFVRLASSNSFIESQDEVTATRIQGRPFTALYGGGWLEFEIPFGSRARLMLRGEVEAWDLENNPNSFFFIPETARAVQSDINLQLLATAWIELTRRNGLAIEAAFEDSFFFAEGRPQTTEDQEVVDEQQFILTGRVVYRRAWMPNLLTDVSLGLTGVRPRPSGQAEPNPGEWVLVGGWQLNFVGGASLVYFGRPRWLTLRFSYDRSYEQLDFRNLGSAHDAINLLAAFGPFDGFTVAATLSWSRFAVEVQRLTNAECQANPAGCVVRQDYPSFPDDATREQIEQGCSEFYEGSGSQAEQCDYADSWTRTFNTIGLSVDVRYLFEAGSFLMGPFFEGYIYGQIGEGRDEDNTRDALCERVRQPFIDNNDCYMPPHHDPIEAILMLGFRVQWSAGNARSPRRASAAGGAAAGSRAERRMALQRATREDRLIPGFGYRSDGAVSGDGADGLFGRDDPMGRLDGDPLGRGLTDGVDQEGLPSDREPGDETDQETVAEPTGDQEPAEEWQWFGEEPEPEDPPSEPEGDEQGEEGADEDDEPTEAE